jgi:hypothetical protein
MIPNAATAVPKVMMRRNVRILCLLQKPMDARCFPSEGYSLTRRGEPQRRLVAIAFGAVGSIAASGG